MVANPRKGTGIKHDVCHRSFGRKIPNSSPVSTQHPLLRLILGLLSTTEQTGSPGGNKTGLLTLCGVAGDGRGLTDMLVVTTTVRL